MKVKIYFIFFAVVFFINETSYAQNFTLEGLGFGGIKDSSRNDSGYISNGRTGTISSKHSYQDVKDAMDNGVMLYGSEKDVDRKIDDFLMERRYNASSD